MTAYTKVVVAGATGNLGPSVTKGLVDAGIEVTVFSRTGKRPDNVSSDVKVVTVDYNSQDSLIAALKGQDAVVSTLPDQAAQKALIDASIAAGVKRYIPSEFGGDVAGNEKCAALPVFGDKKAVQEYLKTKGDAISYTIVVTGAFLDWGLEHGFLLKTRDGPMMVYPQGGPAKIFDGGARKQSTTLLSDIGKAVANVLKKPEETKNRAMYIESAAVSQQQLLEIMEKIKPGSRPETEDVVVSELTKQGYELLAKGQIMPAMLSFIWTSTFGEGYDGVWKRNDNELLGIKELSDTELEGVVKQYV